MELEIARTPLQEILHNISTNEQVALALGLGNLAEHDEEFLQGQRRAARRRFLSLCLYELDMDMSLEISDLSEEELDDVTASAQQLVGDWVQDAKTVRTWWLQRGQAEYNTAVHRSRELKRIDKARLSVLVVLEAGGAKYLAYGPNPTDIRLVASPEDAYSMRPKLLSELSSEFLQERAKDFKYLLEPLKAKEIKVLARFIK